MARMGLRQRRALLYYILLGIHIQNMVVLDVGRGSAPHVSHFTSAIHSRLPRKTSL